LRLGRVGVETDSQAFPVRASTIAKCSRNLRETEMDLRALSDVVAYHGKQPDIQEITRIFSSVAAFSPIF